MFTGIIEATGTIKHIQPDKGNLAFIVESPLSGQLKVDQSVSHNGVCLTVESIAGNTHTVTAIAETLKKTNLKSFSEGDIVNLERSMQLNTRLDGHIVQGHVDATAICASVNESSGSWEYRFEFDKKFAPLIIEKGSICVNGISLTAFNVTTSSFTVAIIPYTYHYTNISHVKPGSDVNIEFDIIGKYILRAKQVEGQVS